MLRSDLMTVALMVLEFILGATIGSFTTLMARASASNSDCCQVVPAHEFQSQEFGKKFPKHGFGPLAWATKFVIVESFDGEIVKERYYTLFGASCEAIYRNGQYGSLEYSALGAAFYLCTVFLPSVGHLY